jgi:hypothetical protein
VHQILVGGVTFDGVALVAPLVTYPINLDSGGNVVVTMTIPTTAGSSSLTPGTYVVNVTDDAGRVGTVNLTVPARILTINPTSSGRGSVISVSGSGFAKDSTVTIKYAGTVVTTLQTNASGAIAGQFTVPLSAGIPSINTVLATDNTTLKEVTVVHQLPNPGLTITPGSAFPGSTISVSGTSFPAFTILTGLTIGGNNAIPSPAPNTDGNGSITFNVLVPQVAQGISAVVVTIGGTTATGTLNIGAAPVTPTNASTALAALINTANPSASVLSIAWAQDLTTGAFSFLAPGVGTSTLTSIAPNSALFLNLTTATNLIISGRAAVSVPAGGRWIAFGDAVTIAIAP